MTRVSQIYWNYLRRCSINQKNFPHPCTKWRRPAKIIRLCYFFNSICSKVVDPSKLQQLQNEVIVTLCLLEKYFPLTFFDVMVHLTVHLPREIKFCGPVWLRWMYSMERYMKILKGYVRNRYRPGWGMHYRVLYCERGCGILFRVIGQRPNNWDSLGCWRENWE